MEDTFLQNSFIELSQVLRNPLSVYAHRNGKEKEWETLEEHTLLCRKYFVRIYEEKNIGEKMELLEKEYLGETDNETARLLTEMLCNVISFHDIGKHNPNFQRNIMEREEVQKDASYRSAGNEHSILSAVLYLDYYDRKIRETGGPESKKLCMLMPSQDTIAICFL